MRKSIFLSKSIIGMMIFFLLQACYVQKNSETHATMVYETATGEEHIPQYNNDVITVAEHHDPIASLEALSARIILMDIQKQRINPRWEDDIGYGYPGLDSKDLIAEEVEREQFEPGVISSY